MMPDHLATIHNRRGPNDQERGPITYSGVPDQRGPAATPEVLGEAYRIRLWLKRRRLTLTEALERGMEPAGLHYLSLESLAGSAG